METGLGGKVAVVSGGSRGIGKATAARLVAEGAGVLTCARDGDRLALAVEEIAAAGSGRVIGAVADARDAEQLEGLVDRALQGVRAPRHPGQQRRFVGASGLPGHYRIRPSSGSAIHGKTPVRAPG